MKKFALFVMLFSFGITAYGQTWDYIVQKYDAANDKMVDITCQRDEYYYYCPGEDKQLIRDNTPALRENKDIVKSLEGKKITLPNGSSGHLHVFGNQIEIRKY